VALAITAAVYLPAVTYEFVYDDRNQIVLSQPFFAWRLVPHYFTSDVWSHVLGRVSNYYRPIFMTWLMLNGKMFGADPVFWHLGAIALHLAATGLVYCVARKLLRDGMAAGIAALLFGIHPVHVEAVAWVSGATESLFATLAFGALLCHMLWREAPAVTAGRWRIASVALFAGALFAKETALVLPVLFCAYEWLFPADPAADSRLRRIFWTILPQAAVIFVYLGLRFNALHSLFHATAVWTPAMILSTLPLAMAFYLRQLLLPVQFSLFYPWPRVTNPGIANFSIPLLSVIAAVAILFAISRRSRQAAFASLLLTIPILPVLNLRAVPVDDFLHDRYLYLSVAGLGLLAAMAWQRLPAGWLRVAAAAVLGMYFAGATLYASHMWKDNLSLYSRAIEVAPGNAMAQMYLGDELLKRNRPADALPWLKKAAGTADDKYTVYVDTAWCYVLIGDDRQARPYLQDAIQTDPQRPLGYRELALLEWRQGRVDEAETQIRKALAVRRTSGPAWLQYHSLLATILERKGDLKGALEEYQAELREDPASEEVMNRVQMISAKLGAGGR
jgi:protein O-mannosyl-transferase